MYTVSKPRHRHDHLTTARYENQTDRVGEAICSGCFGSLDWKAKRPQRLVAREIGDRRFVWRELRANGSGKA